MSAKNRESTSIDYRLNNKHEESAWSIAGMTPNSQKRKEQKATDVAEKRPLTLPENDIHERFRVQRLAGLTTRHGANKICREALL
jgi:hypothetical protein